MTETTITMVSRTDSKALTLVDESDEDQKSLPPILRLPAELRRQIWILTLAADDPIHWPRDRSCSTGHRTAILQTCRFVYRETIYLLYRANTLLFKHPSDCNMFIYYHKMELAKQIRSIMFHIQAQEYMLWTGYFGSSFDYRSLKADFPNLDTLNIVLLSDRTLRDQEITPALGFQQWKLDKPLKNICHSLLDRVENGLVVNVLYLKLSTNEHEMQEVLEAFPQVLLATPENSQHPQLRTIPKEFHGMKNFRISLDGTTRSLFVDNPWITEKMFYL